MGRQLLLCCTLLPVESSRVGIEDRKTRLPVVLKRRLERQQWIPVRPGWMVKPMKASHWEDTAAELVGSSSARSPSQVFATCRTQNEVVVARKSPCRLVSRSAAFLETITLNANSILDPSPPWRVMPHHG